MRWLLPKSTQSTFKTVLEKDFNIHSSIAELLISRGFENVNAVSAFLNPKLGNLEDPFLLPDMTAAVACIFEAIDSGQKILLYGDYDVDGVTSVTLLHKILLAFGANVRSYLPDRLKNGYGLSLKGMEDSFKIDKPDLLITLDCGTSSLKEVAEARKMGIEVIIIDHHECGAEIPQCAALVNPKRGSKFEYLCTVGIAFKVAHALLKTRREASIELKEYLDLVALGTVADVVPLTEENRLLVIKGLKQAAHSKWLGLKALLKISGLSGGVQAADISFKIAPRINAAGRLESAGIALDLMMSESEVDVETLVNQLDRLNTQRRSLADDVYNQAEVAVSATFDSTRHKAIVVGGKNWHPGLIGIAAARLVQKYHCPVIVIGFDETGLGKGSARSIEGFSLVEALRHCNGCLIKHGGHHMAAGVGLMESRMEEFQSAFLAYAEQVLGEDALVPRVAPDVQIQLSDITLHLLEGYEAMGPFGTGHPEPLFLLKNIHAAAAPTVMKEKHRSFTFWQNGATARAVWFNSADQELPPPPWDVAFTLSRNDFRGVTSPSIQVRYLRSAEA